MAHWFHRNPLKATGDVKFDMKMIASDSQAQKICSDLKQSRARLLELLPDARHDIATVEEALTLYLALLRGLVHAPEGSDWSKLRHSLRFRWSHSMLGNSPESHFDSVFEMLSILQNASFWYLKHAAAVAGAEEVKQEEAKEVHRSLRRGAGLLQEAGQWAGHLLQQPLKGSDADPRVCAAYVGQATAEAQEVTIARAVEQKHSPALVSALSHETSKLFTTAADSVAPLDDKIFGHWVYYLKLKAAFYMCYAYTYAGENLLAMNKCGESVRALQEAKRFYETAVSLCKDYAQTKGPGTKAKPERHGFFRRLLPLVQRTLDKAERENGMIYHEKVPHDAPQLELRATYGLAAPEPYTPPPPAPLWTSATYAAFDLTKNMTQDAGQNSKAAQNPGGDLPAVKEAPVNSRVEDGEDRGCSVM